MIIDVSEHNGTLAWEGLKPKIEGAILRCGYGSDKTSQDDKQWARNVSECERLGIPYGVYLYSYAKNEDMAHSEGSHVLRLLKGHKPALPVFWDIEENGLQHTARKNFYAFEETIGSNYRVGLYTGEYYYNACCYGVAAKYLWIAKYGRNTGTEPAYPPDLQDGKKYQLWQYTSKLWGKNLDASKIIDRAALFGASAVVQEKTLAEVAQEVINGLWGNGDARKQALTAAGWDYSKVQAKVNEMLKADQKKSVDEIAREVIAGKWGNGKARTAALTKAGYNAADVQRRVNQLMG